MTTDTQSINFDNTDIAFAARSDKELRKTYALFWMMNNPILVKSGTALAQLAFRLKLPVKGLVRNTLFAQFCGGEHISDCEPTIAQLNEYGIGTILDYAVEGTKNEKSFDRTCQEIVATIQKAATSPEIPFSVFKPTGVASFALLEKVHSNQTLTSQEEAAWKRVHDRFDVICRTAHEHKVKLMIDAEESWIQKGIDRLAQEMMQRYNQQEAIVYNTYQMYLKSSLTRLQKDFQEAEEHNYFFGAKLVRGAYMEKERERAARLDYEDPIQPDKHTTDDDFDKGLTFCVEHRERASVVAGTHNEYSNYHLTVLMQKNGIAPNDNRFHFAQLYGMSDHISYNLAHLGYNVVKYVPYGPIDKVMPYLFRRAEENTSIAGQSSREFSLIQREMRRRKRA